MKLIVLAALVLVASASLEHAKSLGTGTLEQMFQNWIIENEKVYSSLEETHHRFGVFQENLRVIEELQENEEGTAEYGATSWADLTPEEFADGHLMVMDMEPYDGFADSPHRLDFVPIQEREDKTIRAAGGRGPEVSSPNDLPEAWDWQNDADNVVGKVKNQGSCGSCWAFSGACQGGWPWATMEWLAAGQGLVSEDAVPYTSAGAGGSDYICIEDYTPTDFCPDYDIKCNFHCSTAEEKYDEEDVIGQISSYISTTEHDEDELQLALYEHGPVSVCIDASFLQFYKKGISKSKFCTKKGNINHAVTLVGYGVGQKRGKEMPFWRVMNSWGTKFGEDGYFRLFRGDNHCAIADYAVVGVV